MYLEVFRLSFQLARDRPALALAGLAAIITIYGKDLPDYAQLEHYEPATLSRIYSGQGALMDEFARERRIFTPIDEIPDQIKQAFISAEDKNFYEHHGFDPRGIVAALYDAAAKGGRLRGASTITQQVMKNFLLTGDRSGERKIKEIILATRLENTLSKDEILQLYLNEIFLGQNAYGVTAAAQTYFAKSLEELTLAETAYLAALPQAPSVLHPVREKPRAIARRNYVLDQMADNGYVTRDAAEAAKAEDLLTVQCGAIPSARSEMPPRDYFTDEIRRQLSAKLGDERALHRRPDHPRHRRPRPAGGGGAGAPRRAREVRPRHQGLPRAGGADRPGELRPRDEASWRGALPAPQAPRDIDGWHPAVILGLEESRARIGVDGVPRRPTATTSRFADASWARIRAAEGGRLRAAEGPDDMWDVGDVDPREGGREGRRLRPLVLPPDPGDPGRLHGDGHPDRPRPRHAGRLLLPVERLQPRHPGAAPARLVLQALRLRRRPRQRLLARRPSSSTPRSRWRPAPASGSRRTRATPTTARRRCAPASSSRAT